MTVQINPQSSVGSACGISGAVDWVVVEVEDVGGSAKGPGEQPLLRGWRRCGL